MKNFRNQFPLLNQYTYLNTAASGLLPESVMEFRQDHDLDFLISGSILKEKQGELLSSVRESVGRLFGCAPERVALTPNFSYGFNLLMEGLDASKKVLLLENDYPSVNWAVESRGFKTCYAKIDENIEQNIAEVVEKEKPDVFAFSLVQYISGIKLDFAFLKKLKEEYPHMLLLADGTQYCGTESFSFEDSALDVLGASGYKWMNAGYGNGFFLFKQHMEKEISPKTLGFNSLQGKYKPHEGSLIGKFEPGHQDTLNFGSLKAAIDLINRIGMDVIQSQNQKLSTEAKSVFLEMGLLQEGLATRQIQSCIFNLRLDEVMFRNLRAKNIICSQRGDGLRLSFHYFNTSEDLEKLARALRNKK